MGDPMGRLNPIEQECQTVLIMLRDMMAPGRGKIDHISHMELCGRVRDALEKLQNKEYGCATGKHAGPCQCQP